MTDQTDQSEQVDRIEQLAEQVTGPGPAEGTGTDPAGYGRLAELADWWRAVGGDPAPQTGPVTPARLDVAPADALPGDALPGDALPADVDAAVEWGCARADALADGGADLVLVAGPDRVAARTLAAFLIDLDPVDATGFPARAGISDAEWTVEVAALRDGLRRLNGLRGTPAPMLRALGSAPVAATVAALLQLAVRRVPVLLDGEAAACCALMARRLAPPAREWWQLCALRDDPLTERLRRSLVLEPLTTLGIRVEDGTGLELGLALLRVAAGLPRMPEPEPDPDDDGPAAWMPPPEEE